MLFLPLIISIHFTIVLSLQKCPCTGLELSPDHQSASCRCYMCLNEIGLFVGEEIDGPDGYQKKHYYAENAECPDLDSNIKYAFEPLRSLENKVKSFGQWKKHEMTDGKTEWQCLSSSNKWKLPKPLIVVVDENPDEKRRRYPVEIWANGVNPCPTPAKRRRSPHYAVCTYDLSISTPNLFEPNYL